MERSAIILARAIFSPMRARVERGVAWRKLLTVAMVVTVIATAGCGYHLRGDVTNDFAFTTVSVDGADNDPQLVAAVKDGLMRAGLTVSETSADRHLKLDNSQNTRDASAVDSAGKIAVYALNYAVTFSYLDAKGVALLSGARVAAKREYDFNEQDVMGKDQERDALLRDMRKDLVREILRRLSRAERKTKTIE